FHQLEVSADQAGRVELQGQVETLYDKYRIHNIVTKVQGVNAITNQLMVEPEPLPDEEIEENIETAIKRNSAIVEPQRINVQVNNGVVFLTGTVSFNREKEMAQSIASWKQGVKAIENKLEVLPPGKALSDENLERILGQILDYQFPTEDKVSFDVENGKVILKGTVANLWTKQTIEDEFRNVVGVSDVLNNLKIQGYEGS
nr:BON domain-containing protein [Gammaproteobacteria bacterium]